ncbi:MAG: hypothetical protein N4A68_15345 [Maledivibacter sp.]|jgi:hypothetical protein|nr:hypothetical protein [Maledivibacter sp.]
MNFVIIEQNISKNSRITCVDHGFSGFKEDLNEYHSLAWVVRAQTMDEVVENFIKTIQKV